MTVEKEFDINILLMTVYTSIETIREEKGIEPVFDVEPRVPREMKGDVDALSHLLSHLLMFLMPYSLYKEIVLHIDAPEDFVYQENVLFYLDMAAIDITPRKAHHFFQTRLQMLLKKLGATPIVDEENGRIGVDVPLKIKELGNRRHYRLPDIRMLGKKVLLISDNKFVSESIAKMFRYFLYEVDEGVEAYKKRGSNLGVYDIFVLDDSLYNEGIEALVRQVRSKKDLKFVLIKRAVSDVKQKDELVSAYLIRPVMQESIFELIVSLYKDVSKTHEITMDDEVKVIDMGRHIDSAFERQERAYVSIMRKEMGTAALFDEHDSELPQIAIDDVDLDTLPVLDVSAGKERCKERRTDYKEQLRLFLDKFNRSDYYFREIVAGRAAVQIKEFALDLEASSHTIGAERMEKLAKRIELMVVYGKVDEMKVFVNRYHIELKKLIVEISNYLKASK
jgi:hypothetical protein